MVVPERGNDTLTGRKGRSELLDWSQGSWAWVGVSIVIAPRKRKTPMPVANGRFTNAMFFDALLFSWQGTAVVWWGPLQCEAGMQLLLTSNRFTEECNAWFCILAGLFYFSSPQVQLLLAPLCWFRDKSGDGFCSAWIDVWVLNGNEQLMPLAICRGLGHESNVDILPTGNIIRSSFYNEQTISFIQQPRCWHFWRPKTYDQSIQIWGWRGQNSTQQKNRSSSDLWTPHYL